MYFCHITYIANPFCDKILTAFCFNACNWLSMFVLLLSYNYLQQKQLIIYVVENVTNDHELL